MGVRSARISDLLAIRALDGDVSAHMLVPPPGTAQASAATLAFLSAWRTFGHRFHTIVLRRGSCARGFAQARARPGRESWDILRIACAALDLESYDRGCGELLERICAATAQRGALRTFVRVASESDRLSLIVDQGFRPYATEVTLLGSLQQLAEGAPDPDPHVRVRTPRDAWDIFSLYCAITPALVRHAEGRSLREWTRPSDQPTLLRRQAEREVVLGEPGNLQAWLRWTPARHRRPQLLEVLVRPESAHRLGEMVRFAARDLGLDLHCMTLCRPREYDGRVSGTLEVAGFEAVVRETLLVRHTVARVTERQLLIAALRAQGLGIDISHYRRGAEPIHQRLASSREAEHHYYDRHDRTSYHR